MKRTLVKSRPELWSELSEVESLARHLGELGEITISRLEPERTVAWEGEHARGTVEIEASGWGTRVTLRAEVQSTVDSRQEEPQPPPAPVEPEPEPIPEPEPVFVALEPEPVVVAEPRRGFFVRWFFRERTERVEPAVMVAEPEPDPQLEPIPEPEPEAVLVAEPEPESEPGIDEERVLAVLETVLDNLGSAHHRPFSRG